MKKVSIGITNDFCPQSLFLYGTYKEDGTPNFGLFCWLSYCWDGEMHIMACIGGEKLTKDRIRTGKVFSANLVTEATLPLADYLGNTEGYVENKMKALPADEVMRGAVLDVPVLKNSPVSFELEVKQAIPLDDGELYICKVRNVLVDETLTDESLSVESRIRSVAPVVTTKESYFRLNPAPIGAWGDWKDAYK